EVSAITYASVNEATTRSAPADARRWIGGSPAKARTNDGTARPPGRIGRRGPIRDAAGRMPVRALIGNRSSHRAPLRDLDPRYGVLRADVLRAGREDRGRPGKLRRLRVGLAEVARQVEDHVGRP